MASTDPAADGGDDGENLSRLFAPEAIALVGASGDPNKLSGRPYRYLREHGYGGDIHLVNPSRDTIDGRPCHDSIAEVPGDIDLAMVLVPARVAPSVVRECGEAGVPFSMVIASGFGEMGDSGEALEDELLAAARESGTRIIGPNSEGVVNVPASIGASFSSILKREPLLAGNLSFVTQSGAFGGALFQLTQDLGVGAAKWLSTGNEVDLSTIDFLEYLVEDPETDVIATYVESLREGERLRAIGRRAVETGTDIVALRVGRSQQGRRAAASHTGSIASDDAIYDAMFTEAGLTQVRSVDAFTDAVAAFARVPVEDYPRVDGGGGVGLGVVSISGGAAALIADACEQVGLPLAELSPATEAAIAERIPEYGAERNPVDVTGAAISQPELFEQCLRLVAEDDAVTALLLQFGNSGPETLEVCRDVLVDIRASLPVVTVFTGGVPSEAARRGLIEDGILYHEDPVRAVTAVGALATRAADRERVADLPIASPTPRADREPLPTRWEDLVAALAEAGLEVAPSTAVADDEGAVAAAEAYGYPVVMKYSPLDVEHKAEVAGVRTGLDGPAAVRAAFASLASADIDAEVLVQPTVEGTEAIVGVVDDQDFGPVMLVGPGGTFVELFDDFAYAGVPVSRAMADRAIASTALDRLLAGFRDRPAGDADALASAVVAASTFYERYDCTELEFNPIIVTEDAAVAVDVLVR